MKRFWDKVDKTGECWIWTAYTKTDGYGQFKFDGKMRGAHRMAWLLTNGEIPDGMLVCHTCDNPSCVNPNHLFLGTNQDNADDKMNKGRHASVSQTHCKRGHEFSRANTRFSAQHGGFARHCRECNKILYQAQRILVGGVN